ncbi:MAG: methyl-accepting chemotaxis protein [Terracidiphilus sp.]|jgi:methyl-accepting chemotaxis protein
MSWFKNLNAAPRLMISFGALLVLTLGIGYLSITNLSKANDRLGALYQEDMLGAMRVNDIAVARAMNGRSVRDAMLHINEPSVVAENEKVSFTEIASIRADIEAAEKSASSDESKEVLTIMSNALPAYEQGHREIYQYIEGKDLVRAQAKLASVTEAAKPLFDAAARAIDIKQKHAEEKFQVNRESYQAARTMVIGASFLSLSLGIILTIVIARSFSVPLGQAVTALERVAAGDLTASLNVETHDEVGRMAKALNGAVERLNSTMQEVADNAANASSSSQQLAAASEAIASGAQEQAASLEETSSSLEQISAAVRLSADNAMKASDLASGSRHSADRGQEGTNAVAAMADISAASAKISDIISTVDEIAFQTNLLAVNAAVEAARAGDEGRGFAVVASEVRSLAQRSASAAKEIKGLIQDSMRKVDRGSELVNRVTQLVGEIAHTSAEQSAGIEQVNTAMTQMDQVTQSNSAQTEELSATAESLSEQAAHLLELIGTFTLTEGGKRQQDQNLSLHPISTLHSSSDRQKLAGHIRSNGAAKWSSNPRCSKLPKNGKPAQTVTIPSKPLLTDASFEEF